MTNSRIWPGNPIIYPFSWLSPLAACSVGHTDNGGSCYYFSQSKSNFDSSKSSCDDLGMHLVYIGSEDEQVFLVNNLPEAYVYCWIGLSRVTWMDGSSLTYPNFADDSETFDESGMCFVIQPDKSYQWLDNDCDQNRYYICEKEGGEYILMIHSYFSQCHSI